MAIYTIGNTRVSVAYYSFYDNIQLYGMKVTAMEYNLWSSGLGSSTVDQVLKYTKYPKYIPSTSTGQVLIF